jgi:hypothetical protein
MNFGFNTNVHVGKAVYHVQTEDRGPSHPFLDTIVYEGGRVVHRRSTDYQDLAKLAVDSEARQQVLHERLAQQHRDVIAQLEAGSLPLGTQAGRRPQKSVPPIQPGLEVRLLNPSSWLTSGNATLEIEVRLRSVARGAAQDFVDAKVEAAIEDPGGDSVAFRTHTNPSGRATLKFPIPSTVADGAELVIRAAQGSLSNELRFRIRARPKVQVPAASRK